MVEVITTRNKPKQFAWSYTKLKNFETCPKRYFHIDVEKTFKEDPNNEHLRYGEFVHEGLANRINSEHTPLSPTIAKLEPWAEKILHPPYDRILVEQQMAIREDLQPTAWFDNDVWFRGIADVIKKAGPVALAIDWKTGNIKEDGVQLALIAACVFAHHPEIMKIRTEFVWLKEDATSRADFSREDMPEVWAKLLPRVSRLKLAHDTMSFPPTPNGLCRKFCTVTACPYHGVGN
jgi:hypothetical protein